MDSLLEKKLENPRMNLEGKFKLHNATNGIFTRRVNSIKLHVHGLTAKPEKS